MSTIARRREYIIRALETLVKNINIDIMHWKLVKSEMFNFMKVKKLMFLMKFSIFDILNYCP